MPLCRRLLSPHWPAPLRRSRRGISISNSPRLTPVSMATPRGRTTASIKTGSSSSRSSSAPSAPLAAFMSPRVISTATARPMPGRTRTSQSRSAKRSSNRSPPPLPTRKSQRPTMTTPPPCCCPPYKKSARPRCGCPPGPVAPPDRRSRGWRSSKSPPAARAGSSTP